MPEPAGTTPGDKVAASKRGSDPVLEIKDLHVSFDTDDGVVKAVDGVSYEIYPGETLGVVGESGSGKSVTVMTILGLVQAGSGTTVTGEALFDGHDLLKAPKDELRRIRGRDIAMIFQDPMTSLNPVFKVGEQLSEAIQAHDKDVSDDEGIERATDLLKLVGVPNADKRVDQYPHEFSGGMRQRAMIAMAIANQPKVLIADEPTTALDVTIQAQIVEVLETAQDETHAATILITHDLGMVAEMADRVVVMYAGHVVEMADVHTLFHSPRHPYTVGLLESLPQLDVDREMLNPIQGQPPSLINVPPGCPFHPRCFLMKGRERCQTEVPELRPIGSPEHLAACHFAEELAGYKSSMAEARS